MAWKKNLIDINLELILIYKKYIINIFTHGDCEWNNINTFERIQKKYIAKFDSVKINTDGVMYDNKNVYTFNNSYYKKSMIEKKIEHENLGKYCSI